MRTRSVIALYALAAGLVPFEAVSPEMAFAHGDWNTNGVIDLDDYAQFPACLTGPGGALGPGCGVFDFNDDDDVDLADFAAFQELLAGGSGDGQPRVGSYANSGCLDPERGSPREDTCPSDDEILLTVEGGTLYTVHENATYNCCPDDIEVSLSVEENVLRLTEEEVFVTEPCACICCYAVEATVVDLAPGEYTVEYCWYDYEDGTERCHVEDIVVP
jgi:hypothetical protein